MILFAYAPAVVLAIIAGYFAFKAHRYYQDGEAYFLRALNLPFDCVCETWEDEAEDEDVDDYELAEGEHQYEEKIA